MAQSLRRRICESKRRGSRPKQGRLFQRTVEAFICENCGAAVSGDGYTNHCPSCLWSLHCDRQPGDRAEPCQGLMLPYALTRKAQTLCVVQRCKRCGIIRINRLAKGDNHDLAQSLPLVDYNELKSKGSYRR